MLRSLCVSPHPSVLLNFESDGPAKERVTALDRYKRRPSNLKEISLLEFATHYDWRGERVYKRGTNGAKPYVVSVWPRYKPDPDNEESYNGYCYARLLLHHPFTSIEDLKGGFDTWRDAYHSTCLAHQHEHPKDTLPEIQSALEEDTDLETSDEESVLGDEEVPWVADWMVEARRNPGQGVAQNPVNHLGYRELDLEHDWHQNSLSSANLIVAAQWIKVHVKESPNDDIQTLPEVSYTTLKGEQRLVFLQVMAYFKKVLLNDGDTPPPLRINVDGTAGTGKSYLIWAISTALRHLFAQHGQPPTKDPVVRLHQLE
ncbi:hypothetical protein BKA70DRAFT_1427776 [Coprinopsis sp. MPI-PUGE-AT-0042]|nr:hypothetical protein BKA70DRAFT_1427776 [Coprinopsis sp. MPI-PUGE-AT-0042]